MLVMCILASCPGHPFEYTMSQHFPPNNKEKPGYVLEFDEDFQSDTLDTSRWVPYYLPQWSSRNNSRPRYVIRNGHLVLSIDKEQQPWCPEFNGDVKCSSIQTGLFSGAEGSAAGQHRFNPECRVREVQDTVRLYTPLYGYMEIRAKADIGAEHVAAFWLIGFEDMPEKSGEICVMEVKGKDIRKESFSNGYGIHPFSDPSLKDDFYVDRFPWSPGDFTIYAASWEPGQTKFYVNNKLIRTITQSPAYHMQFMLSLYEVPDGQLTSRHPNPTFTVDYVRGYRKK